MRLTVGSLIRCDDEILLELECLDGVDVIVSPGHLDGFQLHLHGELVARRVQLRVLLDPREGENLAVEVCLDIFLVRDALEAWV